MAVTIAGEQLDTLIEQSELQFLKMGEKTMVCHATLPSKFEVVVSAACVDPASFSEEIGKSLCRERLKSRLWELEGYRLQLTQHPDH